MSFVYAEKVQIEDDGIVTPLFHILSDTRLRFDEKYPNKNSWGELLFQRMQKYGTVKSVIINPRCCISFAGNNIKYAHDMLEFAYAKQTASDDELFDKAYRIYQDAGKDEIEFIICTVSANGTGHIMCIKDDMPYNPRDCPQAWIGSSAVFRELRKQYSIDLPKFKQYTSTSMFQRAIDLSHDDSVGDFIVDTRYDFFRQRFVYSERWEYYYDAPQLVPLGGEVRFDESPEKGGFSTHIRESYDDFVVDIMQNDVSVVYTNRFRTQDINTCLEDIRFFLLPICIRTSTGKIL